MKWWYVKDKAQLQYIHQNFLKLPNELFTNLDALKMSDLYQNKIQRSRANSFNSHILANHICARQEVVPWRRTWFESS